jgi:carbonic anhydrase
MNMHVDCSCAAHDRRSFMLGSAGLGLAAAAAGLATFAPAAAAASLSKAQRDAMTPDAVIKAMMDGNARFLAGSQKPRDFLAEMRSSAAGQYPAAVVLSCVDSRAPVELICDLGLGDTFNARVAGNAVNDDILGSMEFACAAAGAKAVVVMGHTACGAIKGAIDGVVLGNLTLLLARFKSAIEATTYKGDRSSKNAAFVDAVAATHVAQTVKTIRARSTVLADLETKKSIRIVGSMYDIATGKISLL